MLDLTTGGSKFMKIRILLFFILLSTIVTACTSKFDIPPAPPSPVSIRIMGDNNIVSSMPLDTTTVSEAIATHVANGQAALRLTLTDKGSKALYTISTTNIGKLLDIYWQDTVISESPIQSPLGGSTMTFVIVLPDSTPNEIQGMINSIRNQKPLS